MCTPCLPPLSPAPLELRKVSEILVKPAGATYSTAQTNLSCLDQINAITATARSWCWRNQRLDVIALQAALQATITDLPFLAGRVGKLTGGALGSLHIEHNGAGTPFTVLETDSTCDDLGPTTWPQACITLSQPATPFCIPQMDGWRVMSGKDPVMSVQVTRLADGDCLGITVAHIVTDGIRWPALAAHLAARYRQHGSGQSANPTQLLCPTERRLMSSSHMAVQLGCVSEAWRAHQPVVAPSLAGYWRLGKLLLADGRQRMQLLLLHVPAKDLVSLKVLAAGGNPAITTGDAVQATCALLLHAALGRPPLPVKPFSMAALVQLPTPTKEYFGNAAHMLRVSLPEGTRQPADSDHVGALQQLAGAIRQSTAAFRSDPEVPVKELRDLECLVAAPAHHMLSFLAKARMPFLTCTTNYVPQQQDIDLGLGPSTYQIGLTLPRARDMAVIRPACQPFSEGLFVQLCLAPSQAAKLRRLPLLAQLLPSASFVSRA